MVFQLTIQAREQVWDGGNRGPPPQSISRFAPLKTILHSDEIFVQFQGLIGRFGLKTHLDSFQGTGQTIWPAANPDDQAHWKLKPPRWPVTSITSPMKNNPGTDLDSKVFDDNSAVSTPPSVTSAVR